MDKAEIIAALKKLREAEKRKFEQAIDLIINLKNFDIRKESVNLFLELPHKVKERKIAAFLTKKSNIVDSILKQDFDKYDKKKDAKRLIRDYDFFIAAAPLMPSIAAIFGKYLGPAGKMPSPQLGIIREENEKDIENIVRKYERVVRVKSKEPSLKFCIGKENMKDEEIADNILAAYNTITNALLKKKENIRSVLIKFTMSKPLKLRV